MIAQLALLVVSGLIQCACGQAPQITLQPADATNYLGGSGVSLYVAASGQNLRFDWYAGQAGNTNNPLDSTWGAPNERYCYVNPTNTTACWVRVSNASGWVDSRVATVTARLPDLPVMTCQPEVLTNIIGAALTVGGICASSQVIHFQWFQGSTGITNNPISTDSQIYVSPTNTTYYWVRLSNAAGFVDSRTITVTAVPLREALSIKWMGAFGKVEVGTIAKRTLSISTLINTSVELVEIRVPAGFSAPSAQYGRFSAASFDIAFSPIEKTRYEGGLTLVFSVPSASVELPISGEGSDASRLVDITTALDFNTVQVGHSARRSISVRNVGASPVSLIGLSLPDGFHATLPSPSLGWGEEITLPVSFSPTRAGDYSGTVQLLSDLTDGIATTALKGEATEATGIVTVPNDQPTINLGIDAAGSGDTVRVLPGVYYERISFGQRSVILTSLYGETGDRSYIDQTIISGDGGSPVVQLWNGDHATIRGFTLSNGSWGVQCSALAPNRSGGVPSRIGCAILDNEIINQKQGGVSFESSGYVATGFILVSSSAYINARVEGNTFQRCDGPGLATRCSGASYRGCWRYATVNCEFLRNIIVNCGSAIRVASVHSAEIDENTVSLRFNTSYGVGADPVHISGPGSAVSMANSIIWNGSGYTLDVDTNSAFTASHSLLANQGTTWPGKENFYSNPLFGNPAANDFSLRPGSPCIDAGLLILPGRMDFTGGAPDVGAIEPSSPEPRVAVRSTNGEVEVYFNGSLQTSTNLTGPFWDVAAAQSPYRASVVEPQCFWRARKN